jgi:putative CocE/NonD family hydrolase
MRTRALLAVLALASCAGASLAEDLRVDRDLAVPMRDGVALRADVYRPAREGRFPVLVFRTPYGKHHAARSDSVHRKAVERGYAVVLQDVRGRYASEGVFDPYRQEGRDGYDTIEWAAAQEWSDGRVGTWGLSYPGAVQWLAAMEQPPHLVSMAPAMTFSSPRRFFYSSGIFDRSWLPWIYQNVAPDARRRLRLPEDDDASRDWSEVAERYESFLPLRELPWLRKEAPYYFEWLAHPPEDPWWDWAELQGPYGRVTAAVLNLSGWYDDAYGVEGAATNFSGLRASRDARTARTHLVIGPWSHGVPSASDGRVGELDFGAQAGFDYDALVLDFHDHYLRGIDNRFAREPPVRYFVMGANVWRDSDAWPPAGRERLTFFLGGETAGGPGRLGADAPAVDSTSAIAADPRNPVVDPYGAPGPHDYGALEGRADVVSFETAPLEADLAVAGRVESRIYVSCDCRDFDLWVRLLDVHPDGRAYNVTTPGNDVVRASYRDPGLRQGPRSVEPGRIYELVLPHALTAVRFGKGHRIRVQVSASFDPHLSRNLQTGESEIVSAESRVATITVHHSRASASRISLDITR